MADLVDAIRRMRRLSDDEKDALEVFKQYTTSKELRILKGLLKEKKIEIQSKPLKINVLRPGKTTQAVQKINDLITQKANNKELDNLTKNAHETLYAMIAPNIVGFETIKKAVALQLFSPEHIHILLLGDPGTGKTQILSSAVDLSPISAMGLGSGTSGAGLAITVKGKEVVKGLLPMADKGLCALDELNLMKEESRASLYNAMEKGFVSYNKGGNAYKFDARVSVLATANPKGDKFVGKDLGELKKQLPFDTALLSRFHLTFLVRKHNIQDFKKITKSLLKGKIKINQNQSLLNEYIKKAKNIEDVKLPAAFEQEIVDFITAIKQDEENYLIEVSPRMVVGFSRLVKAAARMELREEVSHKDVLLVKSIVEESLTI
ncbi:ATP-binding protein [Candidatus Woesearchaeota archaeon]|nr:ATP-binding protein [Candidatus Woesearchaeota archaeon]